MPAEVSGAAREAPAGAADLERELLTARAELDQHLAGQPLATGQAAEPDCQAAPALRDRICSLAERICDLAVDEPDPATAHRCQAATEACEQARADVDAACP